MEEITQESPESATRKSSTCLAHAGKPEKCYAAGRAIRSRRTRFNAIADGGAVGPSGRHKRLAGDCAFEYFEGTRICLQSSVSRVGTPGPTAHLTHAMGKASAIGTQAGRPSLGSVRPQITSVVRPRSGPSIGSRTFKGKAKSVKCWGKSRDRL